jgi:hypothetical protein
VVAHELAHIKNRDTLTMTLAATVAGAIGFVANFAFLLPRSSDGRQSPLGPIGAILAMLLAPLAATLVQLAISRTREFSADRLGPRSAATPLARPRARQDRAGRHRPRPALRRGQPRQRAPLHRQPAPRRRRRAGRPLPHPSADGGPDRGAPGAGAGDADAGARRRRRTVGTAGGRAVGMTTIGQVRHSRVALPGVTLHVAEAGPPTGLPLVLLHGWPEFWATWEPVMDRLSSRHRLIAPTCAASARATTRTPAPATRSAPTSTPTTSPPS